MYVRRRLIVPFSVGAIVVAIATLFLWAIIPARHYDPVCSFEDEPSDSPTISVGHHPVDVCVPLDALTLFCTRDGNPLILRYGLTDASLGRKSVQERWLADTALSSMHSVVCFPTSPLAVMWGYDNLLAVVNLVNGGVISHIQTLDTPSEVVISSDEKFISVADYHQPIIEVHSFPSGQVTYLDPANRKSVPRENAFGPATYYLHICAGDGPTKLYSYCQESGGEAAYLTEWNILTGENKRTASIKGNVNGILTTDGRIVTLGINSADLFSLSDISLVGHVSLPAGPHSACFVASKNCVVLANGSADPFLLDHRKKGRVYFLSCDDAHVIVSAQLHPKRRNVEWVAYSEKHDLLITGSMRELRLWKMQAFLH
jgi:hypothetical protein